MHSKHACFKIVRLEFVMYKTGPSYPYSRGNKTTRELIFSRHWHHTDITTVFAYQHFHIDIGYSCVQVSQHFLSLYLNKVNSKMAVHPLIDGQEH